MPKSNCASDRRNRVELHVHLDGAIRYSTVIDLARKRGMRLPADNEDDLKKHIMSFNNQNLTKFLQPFIMFTSTVKGNKEAIRRIAYEFCEDASKDGTIYAEVRYCPHLLLGDEVQTAREVVTLVNEGLRQGQAQFDVKVRSILCCIKAFPAWSAEILELCKEFRDSGVVGIDLAGDENQSMDKEHIDVFKAAEKAGVRRTVHAGENGTFRNVKEAVEEMHAERIGHGYHVIDDEDTYRQMKELNIHFETCPLSSYCTNSVPLEHSEHPIIRFANDDVNFSINTDDPIMTGHPLTGDFNFAKEKLGLTLEQLSKTELNAARSSFLPEHEKSELIERLQA